jgi:sigma-E factor negative regulatory protein RseA
MFNGSEDGKQGLQQLSALADGELDAAGAALACAHWRGDAEARSAWHAYQLIGDVLRSEELASDTARDARFVRALAQRLATEPVVLAPQAAESSAERPAPRRSRWSWMAPAAVAAGFMAVASMLVVTRGTGSDAGPVALQVNERGLAAVPGAGAPVPVAMTSPAEPPTMFPTEQVVRDARLDRYFAAHKQFGGSSALGAPSGFLRAATTQTTDR